MTDLATEIASLKQSLAEAEGQIRHLEQRISGLGKIANADRAIQAAAEFWNEMILKHFRQREDRPGYEIDWNEIGEALAQALLAAEERGAAGERTAWKECIKDLGPLLVKAKADGVLDTLIEANIWPLPATCVTDADVLHATEVAIAIQPEIEAEQAETKADGVESYSEQMLKKICHDEQVEVWADEMQWDIGLHIVSATDYEHTLAIHESLKDAVVGLAQKVIEETLYHEGRIVKPWAGPAPDVPSPQEGE